MIKVLSLPARHPYTSKFHHSGEIIFCNPETDYFNKIGGIPTPEFIEKTHALDSYDVVHIHFSFDKITTDELRQLLGYFKENKKPIVWTCHSRESQRKKDIGNGELQEILYSYANALISPTEGCKKWILSKFGKSKNIEVIPLGYMADPNLVISKEFDLRKKKNTNFIYLVGDMRENKEINLSVKAFLDSPHLENCTLTVITKPLPEDLNSIDERQRNFLELIISSPRIRLIAKPEVSNKELVGIFSEQHVCLLPYLWGTHSGQVELAKDCGCYAAISDVGFYKEQWQEVVEFSANKDLRIFILNFTEALIAAKNKPLLSPKPRERKAEMKIITEKHANLYRNLLGN